MVLSAALLVRSDPLPSPGIGLIVTKDDMAAIRRKAETGISRSISEAIKARLPEAVNQLRELRTFHWPPRGSPLLANMSDESLGSIERHYLPSVPVVAAHYLLTGETYGVEDAIWCMQQWAHYNRIGWYAWNGGSFPQIHYGSIVRVTAFAYDWLYEAMSEEARRDVEAALLMAGRDYYRLNLIGPGMLMHHLRHHNQGNNAFCSALAATLATRAHNPDADRWLRAYIETFLWNLTHAFGPQGQDLENDLQGYWTIALDAVVQSAVMLRNTLGLDFLTHPHLRTAHHFWMAHLAPCKPVLYTGGSARRESPYDESFEGYAWVQNAPACTVHNAVVSHSMLLFAALHRDGAGLSLWRQSMLDPGERVRRDCLSMGHTGTIGGMLALAWFPTDLKPSPIEGPLAYVSERLALWRSGLVSGKDSMLTFNGGQMNLIERGEQLGTGVGLVWHNPHFHYAPAQNTLWTEEEDLQPSYRLTSSFIGETANYFSATGAFSNTRYYPHSAQLHAYRRFQILERDILWRKGRFWVIFDRVAQNAPRSHAFIWNTLNTDRNACYKFRESHATLQRRQTALDFFFAEPSQVTFRSYPTHLMPVWNFSWSEHGLAFEAREGTGMTNIEAITEIPVDGFAGVDLLDNVGPISLEVPSGPDDSLARGGERDLDDLLLDARPPTVKTARVRVGKDPGRRTYRHVKRYPIVGGRYYTLELIYSKFNLRQYHNPAWQVIAIFYDRDGQALNAATWQNPCSACLTEADGETAVADRSIVRRFVAVPRNAETVGFELQTWEIFEASGRPIAAGTPSELYLHQLRLLRHPEPERSLRIRFLTLLRSRNVADSPPNVRINRVADGSITRMPRADGGWDIVVSAETPLRDPEGLFEFEGRLATLSLSSSGRLEEAFMAQVLRFSSTAMGLSVGADAPITLEKCSSGIFLQTFRRTTIHIKDGSVEASGTADSGFYRLQGRTMMTLSGRYDPAVDVAPMDQTAYREGVGRWFEEWNETAADTSFGRNLLQNATFRASSVLQPRFAPSLVNDGRIAEAWGDGSLLYREDEILSAGFGGYGGDWHTASYPWPYRIRPTYWLAGDEEKEAWIEAELPRTETVRLIRLHNTCNAGFNDRAMIDFQIDLFDETGRLIRRITDHFGKPVPESVQYPGQSYGGGWRFWFHPDTPVPHGEGWKIIPLGDPVPVRRLRITCLRYWGYGAGLSEWQAF